MILRGDTLTEKSLVPSPAMGPLHVRDQMGLMLIQKKVLVTLLDTPDWKDACKACEIAPSTMQRWLRDDAAFQKAYNNLLSGYLTETKGKLASLLPKVGDVFEEGLEADKIISVDCTCPKCGKEFKQPVRIEDKAHRQHVAETLLKQHGQLAQKHEVEVVNRSIEDQLALATIERYGPTAVAPDILTRLREHGWYAPATAEVIEGEFTESPMPDTEPEEPPA